MKIEGWGGLTALALSLASCGSPPAFAADNCRPTVEVVELAQQHHWDSVVVRGPAMARWVEIADSLDIHLIPDFVMIQFDPTNKAAMIWLGRGNEVCDPIMGPIEDIRRILEMA